MTWIRSVPPLQKPSIGGTYSGNQLFHSAEAIEKLLDGVKRCAVQFLAALQQVKVQAEFLVQRLRIVANNVKTATFGWPLWSESADNDMPAGFDRAGYLTDISDARLWRGQKMKYGAIMPHIVSVRLKVCVSNIGRQPMNPRSRRA